VKRVALLASVLAVAACHQTRKTLTPDVPTNGDPSARMRFTEARAKFLRDGGTGVAFAQIVQDFPNDPIVPWADLYTGIADVKARKLTTADAALQKVIDTNADEQLTLRAQLFLGIAKNYEGDAAAARKLLARSGKAVEGDDERTEYLAAIAFATAAGDQPLQSLRMFDELFTRVTPTEKALIVARVEAVVSAADIEGLKRAFDELTDRRAPGYAVAATRLAQVAADGGDETGAQRLREAAGPARAAVGLPRALVDVAPLATTGGDSGVVGAVLPLGSKRDARIADGAITALGLAAGEGGGAAMMAVEMRGALDAASASAAVESLAKAGAVAIIGPMEAAAVDAAGGRAEALGVPLLSLSVHPEKNTTGKFIFHVRHSPLARARVLARRALAAGVTTFAVTGPDNPYGNEVTAAFAAEVTKGGGKVVATFLYKNDEKSFSGTASKLNGSWTGVFVADTAERLELIAPALATSGAVPKPIGTKKVTGGRPVLLLSTAEALVDAGGFVGTTGRYAEGALLAPGYFNDDADPASKAFSDRYLAAYGHKPGAGEAYAYDAAELAATVAGGRAGLAAQLAKQEAVGLTGTIKFDNDHLRADPGVIYTVVEDGGSFAIHVAK
jgi:ABC-type branched-subunit amino acid transport system substrate-binding protein